MQDFFIRMNPQQRAVLEKRTRLLAQATDALVSTREQESIECLLFTSGGVQYGIEKDYVLELHRDIIPLPLPCVPDFVKGIVNIRGSILSVNDLGLFLGNEALKSAHYYAMFQLRYEDLKIGVLAESVDDIVQIALEDIHHLESPNQKRLQKYLHGVTSKMVNILDGRAILSDQGLLVV